MNFSRTLFVSAVSAAVLTLAGCGSSVKLDDQAGSGAAPITSATPGADANAASSSNVASVVVPDQNAGAEASGLTRVIYFDFDSFVVKDEFRDGIAGHAKRLNANKGKKIIVEGHTDERGGREYNLALGQKRADVVKQALMLLGAKEAQIESVSLGEEKPRCEDRTETCYAENRRGDMLYSGEF